MSQSPTASQPQAQRWLRLIVVAFIGPCLLVFLRTIKPGWDYRIQSPVGHFWVVTIPSLLAVLMGMLVLRVALVRRDGRALLIGLSFLTLSLFFFIHAISTPGVVFTTTLHATQWSTPLALFYGAVILALSTSQRLAQQDWLLRHWKLIIGAVLLSWLAYAWFMMLYVPQQSAAETAANATAGLEPNPPTLQQDLLRIGNVFFPYLTSTTILLYLWAAWIYGRRWWQTPTRPLAALTYGALLLAQTTLAAEYGLVWHLSFWLYHALLLISLVTITYSALLGYERTGSLSSTMEGLLLGSTLQRQEEAFRSGMKSLLHAFELGDLRSIPQLRRELRERFALAEDQLDLLQQAVAIVAQDREQGRRLQGLADIGRTATLDLNADHLLRTVASTLAQVTNARMVAIGRIRADEQLHVAADHRLIGGQVATEALTIQREQLPLTWLLSTDVPYSEPFAPELAALTPYPEPAPVLLPLIQRTELLGVLAFQPAPGSTIDERLESVIQSVAAQLATALANHQLYHDLQAEHEQLQRSEHSKQQLTQMIVHDLKNPLTAIMSYLEILRRDALSADQHEMVDGARRSSQTMLGLVSDLLNSSRLQEGRLELKKEPVVGLTLIEQSVKDLRPWAHQDDKALVIDVHAADIKLLVDPSLIERVLVNLISNAIKHTPHATTITVGSAIKGECFHLWVHDTGPGIPSDLQPLLFERFRTGNQANQHKNSTGLGLYFCKLAVEAHEGTISVHSNASDGTTFDIRLPISVVVAEAQLVSA